MNIQSLSRTTVLLCVLFGFCIPVAGQTEKLEPETVDILRLLREHKLYNPYGLDPITGRFGSKYLLDDWKLEPETDWRQLLLWDDNFYKKFRIDPITGKVRFRTSLDDRFKFGLPPVGSGTRRCEKLRVLLLLDGKAQGIESMVEADGQIVLRWYSDIFDNPELPGLRNIARLDVRGAESGLTARSVLDYFRDNPLTPNEALFVYVSAHGGYDPHVPDSHFFQLSDQSTYVRADLISALASQPTPSLVVVTDTCANYVDAGLTSSYTSAVESAQKEELIRSLFLEHRGILDFTAASPGQMAWGGMDSGGYFTQTFFDVLSESRIAGLDYNRDGKLTWHEVWDPIRVKTQKAFDSAKLAEIRRGNVKSPMLGQSSQDPYIVRNLQSLAGQPSQIHGHIGSAQRGTLYFESPTSKSSSKGYLFEFTIDVDETLARKKVTAQLRLLDEKGGKRIQYVNASGKRFDVVLQPEIQLPEQNRLKFESIFLPGYWIESGPGIVWYTAELKVFVDGRTVKEYQPHQFGINWSE